MDEDDLTGVNFRLSFRFSYIKPPKLLSVARPQPSIDPVKTLTKHAPASSRLAHPLVGPKPVNQ